jgi:hypothetical protein
MEEPMTDDSPMRRKIDALAEVQRQAKADLAAAETAKIEAKLAAQTEAGLPSEKSPI